MAAYSKTYEVKWADMDPNRHMRHSVYLDYATQTRVTLFSDYDLPMDKVMDMGLGPIMFREEIKYLKEVNMGSDITVHCQIKWMYKDGSKWSFFHQIVKDDNIPVAELTVDGAWLDLDTRKLGMPSKKMMEIMKQYPRVQDFKWITNDTDVSES